jgi:hypothetical protein
VGRIADPGPCRVWAGSPHTNPVGGAPRLRATVPYRAVAASRDRPAHCGAAPMGHSPHSPVSGRDEPAGMPAAFAPVRAAYPNIRDFRRSWCFAVSGEGVVPGLVSPLSRVPGQGQQGGMRPGCSPNGRICPCRAEAGAAGCSMIMGCSPRYSRVTTRDHDFTLPWIPLAGIDGYGLGEPWPRNPGKCETPEVLQNTAKQQVTSSSRLS